MFLLFSIFSIVFHSNTNYFVFVQPKKVLLLKQTLKKEVNKTGGEKANSNLRRRGYIMRIKALLSDTPSTSISYYYGLSGHIWMWSWDNLKYSKIHSSLQCLFGVIFQTMVVSFCSNSPSIAAWLEMVNDCVVNFVSFSLAERANEIIRKLINERVWVSALGKKHLPRVELG